MNINTFIILLIFIILLTFIYNTYFIIKEKQKKKKVSIEPFFTNNIKIITDTNKYNITNEGYVDELIPVKNEVNYINPRINTYHSYNKIGDELIVDYKKKNNYNNYNSIDAQFNDCKPKLFMDLNKKFYKNHFTKQQSTDLPIANIHTSLLCNTSDKLSNYI